MHVETVPCFASSPAAALNAWQSRHAGPLPGWSGVATAAWQRAQSSAGGGAKPVSPWHAAHASLPTCATCPGLAPAARYAAGTCAGAGS
jgi:hypothetical protein